LLQKLKQSS